MNEILTGLGKLKFAMMKQAFDEEIHSGYMDACMPRLQNVTYNKDSFSDTQLNYDGYVLSGGTWNTYRNRK